MKRVLVFVAVLVVGLIALFLIAHRDPEIRVRHASGGPWIIVDAPGARPKIMGRFCPDLDGDGLVDVVALFRRPVGIDWQKYIPWVSSSQRFVGGAAAWLGSASGEILYEVGMDSKADRLGFAHRSRNFAQLVHTPSGGSPLALMPLSRPHHETPATPWENESYDWALRGLQYDLSGQGFALVEAVAPLPDPDNAHRMVVVARKGFRAHYFEVDSSGIVPEAKELLRIPISGNESNFPDRTSIHQRDEGIWVALAWCNPLAIPPEAKFHVRLPTGIETTTTIPLAEFGENRPRTRNIESLRSTPIPDQDGDSAEDFLAILELKRGGEAHLVIFAWSSATGEAIPLLP